jgi:hypothetical protein
MSLGHGTSIVRNGLVLHVDAANPKSYSGAGATWFDLSGNERNLTLFNSPTFDSANAGSFIFDGVDDYAKSTDNGIGIGADLPHSIELWANFSVITGTRWWLMVLGQYSTGAHHWIGTSASNPAFGVWSGLSQVSPNLIGINNWLNITLTFDGVTLTGYVNGIFQESAAASEFNFTNSDFTIGLAIGAEADYNGKVSIAKIYNRGLTANEVTQNFEALRGRYGI